ncbi:family 35 putative beta-galactosidase glycoside hydrolase [Bisporella sp. PMI_857]|nr:family 35 putative beta-galactosidase glycoside hydrolase [Bisporella sp. PMI_857]
MEHQTSSLPRLVKTETAWQLHVDGKPYLVLGGELQNSSLTSAVYMDTVWQKMADTGYNTLLGCVTWEDIEPQEGEFDFTELDLVMAGARAHGIRLVLLWFGSFKNGISTYAPSWVKKNTKRFPRMHQQQGDRSDSRIITTDVLSIFHTESQKADAKAFTTLMRHLKEVDQHHTVIMVQVENEIGLLGDSRDRSTAANKIFEAPVPDSLVKYLIQDWDNLHVDFIAKFPELKVTLESEASKPSSNSWETLFGKSKATDELFMAYHYALYVEQVASAGANEYPLPLYTNVWQNYAGDDSSNDFPIVVGGGGDPGDYPSGGGVSNVIDIWHKFAPSLSFIAPDIYLNDYASSCKKYRHNGQALFIPEQRRDEYGARRIWTAFGSYQAIGTSPFGVDTLEPATAAFTRHYKLLGSVSQIVLEAQRKPNSCIGFFFDELHADGSDPSSPTIANFGDYQVTIERTFVFGKAGPGAGMLIYQGANKFLLIGWGFQAVFRSLSPTSTFTGILSFIEKSVVDVAKGTLKTERKLNGDETRSGKFCMMPNEDPDYGGFPICVTIPARTMIAEVEVYSIEEDADHV